MAPIPSFDDEVRQGIEAQGQDPEFQDLSQQWMRASLDRRYSYHFTWLGRPIIQYPQDILAIQEIIWRTKPTLIVETGIAHGGSLLLSASILELLGAGEVIGIDIDIRPHNRQALEEHPLFKRITLLEGSSTAPEIVATVRERAQNQKVMVILDSMHSHDHVRDELALYAPLVKKGDYLIVLDTIIEDLPPGYFKDRPWDIGNNPKTAVHEFLAANPRFRIDQQIQHKMMLTVGPDGYLECIAD